MNAWILAMYAAVFLLGVFVLWGDGLFQRISTVVWSMLLLVLVFLLRYLCLPHETLDYQNFLAGWVDFFRQNGGFRALNESVGNYNVPYLYFLALFSYSSLDDLYLIKLLSILFDVIMAWGCLRLVGLLTPSVPRRFFAFFGVLLLPTVVLNGAYWGQCDSIYVAFGIWAIYAALSDKPCRSVVFAALAFSFKLQAVFFLPAYLVLLFAKKLKVQHLLLFPLTYLLVVLPAVLLGRPLLETLTLYFNQTESVGSGLNYNSPSVFAFVRGTVDTELYARLGIVAAFLFCAGVFYWAYRARRRLGREALLGVFLLFFIGVPLLLPHMHDRYFFAADVLSLVLCAVAPGFFPVPLLCSFASLLGYHAYLRMQFLLPMHYGTMALIAALILTVIYLCMCLYGQKQARPKQARRT